jgi:hypothetical protein
MLNTALENIMSTVTITYTETRPTLDVAWYRTPTEFISYIQKYNDVRHRTVHGWTSSPDMLSRTHVVSYSSQADYDTFQNDSQCVEELAKITAFNTANNITRGKTIS